MYKHSGGALVAIAKVVFWINFIIAIGAAIAIIVICSKSYFVNTFVGIFVLAPIAAGLIIFFGWLSGLGIAAFGTLVRNSDIIVAQLNQKYEADTNSDENYGIKSTYRESYSSDEINYTSGWRCPKCFKNNASYVGTCGCGYNRDDGKMVDFIKPDVSQSPSRGNIGNSNNDQSKRICKSCQKEYEYNPNGKFCPNCGASLESE